MLATPTLYTQLNNGTSTAGSDCAVMTLMMALSYGSGGRFIPTVSAIRTAAGRRTGGLSTSEIRTALRVLTEKAREKGIEIEYSVPGLAKTEEMVKWLEAGRFVGTAIDYRVLNRLEPQLSGQRTLTAMHAIGLHGLRGTTKLMTTSYDPLYDGRKRAWGQAPLGPQPISIAVVRAAQGPFVSEDGWLFGYSVAAPAKPTLRRGSTGPHVTYAQQRLVAHGRTGVRITGTFGWRSERGTKNFQKLKGLPVTGVVDAATWRRLEEKPS